MWLFEVPTIPILVGQRGKERKQNVTTEKFSYGQKRLWLDKFLLLSLKKKPINHEEV